MKQQNESPSSSPSQLPGAQKAVDDHQQPMNALSPQMLQVVSLHNQEEEVTKAALLLFGHIEDQISRADIKAQLLLAADALLAGTFASLGKGTASSVLSPTLPLLPRVTALCTILMFLALACSFYWALHVITPHLQGSKALTLMYFGQIAQMKEEHFIETFRNQSLEDLKVATLAQVHTKAKIAQMKFARVRWSVTFLMASLVFWAIIQLVLAFS